MKIFQLLSVAVLGLSSAAASATTIWAPTNSDTDFQQIDIFGISTNGGDLVMYDEASFGIGGLVIGSAGGEVRFTANGSDWDATYYSSANVAGGTITLMGDMNFTLGMVWDGNAFGDSSFALCTTCSPDTYFINFDGFRGDGSDVTGTTMGVDLVPAVPVPAAVWLFGSGLIGLVGVARRRA